MFQRITTRKTTRTAKWFRRRLSCERLESRNLLAGDISPHFDGLPVEESSSALVWAAEGEASGQGAKSQSSSQAAEQANGIPFQLAALEARLAALETDNSGLEQRVSDREIQNSGFEGRQAALEQLLLGVSRNDPGGPGDTLTLSRMNLQVVNGSGNTSTINGLGNIILGYDDMSADPDADDQSGSHNLVVGDDHTFSRDSALVAGFNNAATGLHASVTGGANNTASGDFSIVGGGLGNAAHSSYRRHQVSQSDCIDRSAKTRFLTRKLGPCFFNPGYLFPTRSGLECKDISNRLNPLGSHDFRE